MTTNPLTGQPFGTGLCTCNHRVQEHTIRHKPSQGARGYPVALNYEVRGCEVPACPCIAFAPAEGCFV